MSRPGAKRVLAIALAKRLHRKSDALGWAPYRNYERCDHGLCNIHHLRELEAAAEAGHDWPLAMSCLLLDTKDLVERSRAVGQDRLSVDALSDPADSYATIVGMGHDEHGAATAKKTKVHNLLLRLERHQPDVLRFAHDLRVPFGNNQAEQDKHGHDTLDVLGQLAAGRPWLPARAPT